MAENDAFLPVLFKWLQVPKCFLTLSATSASLKSLRLCKHKILFN